MQLLEKELEDYIFDDLESNDGLNLMVRGLTLYQSMHWFRQVDFKEYGICDILGWKRFKGEIIICLIELKAVAIKSECFDQIYRYKTAIESILSRRNISFKIECILIGESIETGHFIQNNCDLKLCKYTYDLNGINFEVFKGNWIKLNSKLQLQDFDKLWQYIER